MARLVNRMIGQMRKALAEDTPNSPAFSNLREELRALRDHRSIFRALLEYEGTYDVDLGLHTELAMDLKVERVAIRSIPAANPFPAPCYTSKYEPFDDRLLHDDLNYFCAVREDLEAVREWGPSDEWLIWVGSGMSLYRFWAIGKLSALRKAFPDQATKLIWHQAGIDIATIRSPLLIARKASLA